MSQVDHRDGPDPLVDTGIGWSPIIPQVRRRGGLVSQVCHLGWVVFRIGRRGGLESQFVIRIDVSGTVVWDIPTSTVVHRVVFGVRPD